MRANDIYRITDLILDIKTELIFLLNPDTLFADLVKFFEKICRNFQGSFAFKQKVDEIYYSKNLFDLSKDLDLYGMEFTVSLRNNQDLIFRIYADSKNWYSMHIETHCNESELSHKIEHFFGISEDLILILQPIYGYTSLMDYEIPEEKFLNNHFILSHFITYFSHAIEPFVSENVWNSVKAHLKESPHLFKTTSQGTLVCLKDEDFVALINGL